MNLKVIEKRLRIVKRILNFGKDVAGCFFVLCWDMNLPPTLPLGEGVELVETESTAGEENDNTPRPPNTDCIGADNSDQPDVREPEPRAELSTSSVDCHNPEDVRSSEVAELPAQVVPETDSRVLGRPSRKRKPPSRYGTWVAG